MTPHKHKHKHKSSHKKQRQKQRKQIFRKWHRRLGFTVSLFLFNLAITGILLNHYESLALHKNYLSSDWLLNWYDIKAPNEMQCFKLKPTNICQIGGLVYALEKTEKENEQADPLLLIEQSARLINVVQQDNINQLITKDIIYLYDLKFNLVDKINIVEEYAAQIESVLVIEQRLYYKTDNLWLFFDDENYQVAETDEPPLISENQLMKNTFLLTNQIDSNRLKQSYRKRQITYLKFIQDLHSGQILSVTGKWLTDLTGIAVLLLAISGFITWQRRKKAINLS